MLAAASLWLVPVTASAKGKPKLSDDILTRLRGARTETNSVIVTADESAVAEIAKSNAAEPEKVDALYKRILSRQPGAAERALWLDALKRVPKQRQREVYEDVAWALLNSSEFLFNH